MHKSTCSNISNLAQEWLSCVCWACHPTWQRGMWQPNPYEFTRMNFSPSVQIFEIVRCSIGVIWVTGQRPVHQAQFTHLARARAEAWRALSLRSHKINTLQTETVQMYSTKDDVNIWSTKRLLCKCSEAHTHVYTMRRQLPLTLLSNNDKDEESV